MGHMFNCYSFIDDRLMQLLMEEVMNVHQHVLPTIITTIPNVSILGTQAMNPSIGHTIVLVTIKQPSHNLLHQLYQVKPICCLS
jgi:hypothetical protein